MKYLGRRLLYLLGFVIFILMSFSLLVVRASSSLWMNWTWFMKEIYWFGILLVAILSAVFFVLSAYFLNKVFDPMSQNEKIERFLEPYLDAGYKSKIFYAQIEQGKEYPKQKLLVVCDTEISGIPKFDLIRVKVKKICDGVIAYQAGDYLALSINGNFGSTQYKK